MIKRGLACTDRAAAIDLLRAVGYYRLSAYVYPLRESAPVDPGSPAGPVQHRLDTVRGGSTFDHVEALWRWDRKLRPLCLDAIETVEIGVRTRLAYTLGQRDAFGHVHACQALL